MSESDLRIISTVLGTLTVIGLFLYVWKTWQIAKAAVEQAEAVQKPCLTLLQIPDHSDDAVLEGMVAEVSGGPGRLTAKVINIGSGPAINAHFRFYNSRSLGDPMREAPLLPPLSPHVPWDTQYPIMAMAEEEFFVAEYQSLGDQKYRSRATIQHRKWLVDFRFEKIS